MTLQVFSLTRQKQVLSLHIISATMELEQDAYDVVVIGTGLAESIAAAYVRRLARSR